MVMRGRRGRTRAGARGIRERRTGGEGECMQKGRDTLRLCQGGGRGEAACSGSGCGVGGGGGGSWQQQQEQVWREEVEQMQ